MNEARFVMIPGAPEPVAPFSHAVEVAGWVFLTGQMPTDPDNDSAPLPAGVEAQTRRVMDNLILVLKGLASDSAMLSPREPSSPISIGIMRR